MNVRVCAGRVWLLLVVGLTLNACSDPIGIGPDRNVTSAASVDGALGSMAAGEINVMAGGSNYVFAVKWQFFSAAGCTGTASTLRQFSAVTNTGILLRFDTWASMQLTAAAQSSLGDAFVQWTGSNGASTTDAVTCVEYPASTLSYVAHYGASSNTAPVLTPIGTQSADEDALLTFTATATDAETPTANLVFSLSLNAPPGASITPSGLFTWTPTEGQGPGQYLFGVCVQDDGSPAASDCETILVNVAEVNQAPVLQPIADMGTQPGTTVHFTATASDPDQPVNTLTYSLIGAPAGATLNPSTGDFSWTPASAGAYSFEVEVHDNGAPVLADTVTVNIAVNQPPPVILDLSPASGSSWPVGSSIDVTGHFEAVSSGNNGTCVAMAATNTGSPIYGTTGSGTGVCTSVLKLDKAGNYDVTFTVTDGPGQSDSRTISIVVFDVGGGSLTAAGWILSSAGSLQSAPTSTGRAVFNFVSRYARGVAPQGTATFQLQVAGFHFRGMTQDWLLVDPVAGTAELCGTGTVLGDPDVFGYRVSARGATPGSNGSIRIVIWKGSDPNNVIYDSGLNGSVEGGSIQIRRN